MTKVTYTMFISFLSNTFLSVIKILVGFFSKTTSLIADGIHTFSDLSTDLITISNDRSESKKYERIINIIVGIVILLLGLTIIYLSINKNYATPKIWVLIVSLFTIVFKYILSTYVMEKGIIYNNKILVNCAKESDNDVITSVIVFLGLILMLFIDQLPLLKYTDMIVTIIVSLFVIKAGFDVISRELNYMFGSVEENIELLTKIKNIILINKMVKEVDDLRIVKYGPYYELKSEIGISNNISLKRAHQIARQVEKTIKKYYPNIGYIVIKINPID